MAEIIMNGLKIGRLAKQVGIGIETVRFHERQGLIEPPPRTDLNYRIYIPRRKWHDLESLKEQRILDSL